MARRSRETEQPAEQTATVAVVTVPEVRNVCPYCGHEQTYVGQTRDESAVVIRDRQCALCGRTFRTRWYKK